MIRRCVMTGRTSDAKISIRSDDTRSWVKWIPVCAEYKEARDAGKLRNMEEAEKTARDLFYNIELDPGNKLLADRLTKLQQDVLHDIGHLLAASQQDKDSLLEEAMERARSSMDDFELED